MESATSNLFKLNPFNDGKLLEGMFLYRRKLLDLYIEKEMLPTYPVDLSERAAQDFIRDLMGWFVEEMVEAISEWNQMVKIMQEEVYTSNEQTKKFHDLQAKLTQELSDAMHFMLEILVYSDIDPDQMLGYYNDRLVQEGVHADFMTADALITGMMHSRNLNILSDDARTSVFQAYSIPQLPDEALAGSKIGPELVVLIERMCWALTEALFKAKKSLKKKYWKVTEDETNIGVYKEGLMDAWVFFLTLLDLFRMDDKMIYAHYEEKNLINQQRLLNNY